MKNGYLNKSELARITRHFQELSALMDGLKTSDSGCVHVMSPIERETFDLLNDASLKLAQLLRWQSPGQAWKSK